MGSFSVVTGMGLLLSGKNASFTTSSIESLRLRTAGTWQAFLCRASR